MAVPHDKKTLSQFRQICNLKNRTLIINFNKKFTFLVDRVQKLLLKCICNFNIARINLRIWLKSFYR